MLTYQHLLKKYGNLVWVVEEKLEKQHPVSFGKADDDIRLTKLARTLEKFDSIIKSKQE